MTPSEESASARILAALAAYGIDSIEEAVRRCVLDTVFIEPPSRYLLVEERLGSSSLRKAQPCYLTTHESPQDAAVYHSGQEDDQWLACYLLDLETGQRYNAEPSVVFIPVPTQEGVGT